MRPPDSPRATTHRLVLDKFGSRGGWTFHGVPSTRSNIRAIEEQELTGPNRIHQARIRRAVKTRGHFPNEQAAPKCIYLALMSLDPNGTGRKRWTNRWEKDLNAFKGRLTATHR